MNRDDDVDCMCPLHWLENHGDDLESHTDHTFCNYSLDSLGFDTDDHDTDISESTNASGPYCESMGESFSNVSNVSENPLCETVVRFGTISVREFAVTVADLPTSKDSCPVTLDWDYSTIHPIPLNRYEEFRTRRQKPYQLTLEERRQRVATTQGVSMECVKIMEVELMANQVTGKLRSTRHDDCEDEVDGQHEGLIMSHVHDEVELRENIEEEKFSDSDDSRRLITKTLSSKVSDLSLEKLLTAAEVLSLRRPTRKKSPMAVSA